MYSMAWISVTSLCVVISVIEILHSSIYAESLSLKKGCKKIESFFGNMHHTTFCTLYMSCCSVC